MTTNKTIHTFLNNAEEQLKNVLKQQDDYDDIEDSVVLWSIRKDVEAILTNEIGASLTETPLSCLWEKKILDKVCKKLNKIDWWLLWEWMTEDVHDLRWLMKEKLQEEYRESLCESHRQEFEKEWVTDMISLLSDFWLSKYYLKFGKSLIGKILNRTIRPMVLDNLEELWEKLGYISLLDAHRKQLEEIWIIDMKTLWDFWIDNYQDKFGKFCIGRILWGSVVNVGRVEAKKLWEKLWPEW